MSYRIKMKPGKSNAKYTLAIKAVDSKVSPIMTESEFRLLERNNIEKALVLSQGKVYGSCGAAKMLGIPPTTLASRIKKLGIDTP